MHLKALQVLYLLVRSAGELVTYDEFFAKIWPNNTTITNNALSSPIRDLRRLLRSSDPRPYIETVPKRGYRFAVGVRREPLTEKAVSSLGDSTVQRPKSITADLSILQQNGKLKQLFPHTFGDYPAFLYESGTLDLLIIGGSGDREKSEDTAAFRTREASVRPLKRMWQLKRNLAACSPRDYVRIVDLAAMLSAQFASAHNQVRPRYPNELASLCQMDITVGKEMLHRNLILVGGGDTNLYIALAAIAYRERFGYSLPIRFAGDDDLYFTCDQIYSELSGITYSHLEDSSFMHCGYVLMSANPWQPDKSIIYAIGTRATGTQAALLALQGHQLPALAGPLEPWQELSYNNRHNRLIPGKVVRATRALTVSSSDAVTGHTSIQMPTFSRVTQRHLVTDYEFLE